MAFAALLPCPRHLSRLSHSRLQDLVVRFRSQTSRPVEVSCVPEAAIPSKVVAGVRGALHHVCGLPLGYRGLDRRSQALMSPASACSTQLWMWVPSTSFAVAASRVRAQCS